MNPLFPAKSASLVATAILSMGLMSFAPAASAQMMPGGPGAGPDPRGPHMDAQQMGEQGMPGGPRRSRHAERMLRLYDTNGDGKISIAEINADQARMFTALDVDGDKSLSVEEVRRRGRSLQIFLTTTLFDLLDANGDGKLSVAEIQAPSQRWFKRYDKSGDGVMDADEIPDSRGAGGRHGRPGRR